MRSANELSTLVDDDALQHTLIQSVELCSLELYLTYLIFLKAAIFTTMSTD